MAQSTGRELVHVSQSIIDTVIDRQQVVTLGMGSVLAWPALLRKLDRIDPGFRD